MPDIVPSAPGGGYDFIGRLFGEKLGAELGQPFIVENRVGAGTLIGTQAAATSAPDGYTLLVGGLANMAFNPVKIILLNTVQHWVYNIVRRGRNVFICVVG